MSERPDQILDCLIVGGGPAGLTAGIYLARFLRNVLVVDEGKSRAALIPESHNYPGFVYGVSGEELLARLRAQAQEYGCRELQGRIDRLTRKGEVFIAEADGAVLAARRILIATGIVDEGPDLPGLDDFVERGSLRYCPICDAFEALDQRIGVLGRTTSAAHKALFLRTYSRNVLVLPTDDPAPDETVRAELAAAEVTLLSRRVTALARRGNRIAAQCNNGEICEEVDVLYPALGCHVRSDLARGLGAQCDDIGLLVVDDKQKTSIDGLYAAGDVVSDLHQISVATGHAAIAATAIHNSLPPNWR